MKCYRRWYIKMPKFTQCYYYQLGMDHSVVICRNSFIFIIKLKRGMIQGQAYGFPAI